MKITKFLFDLGNVFFDWDPHYVFKNIIPDQTKREYFKYNRVSSFRYEMHAG